MSPHDGTVRVVVVDDDEAVRGVLCEVLSESGLAVVGEAADGCSAITLAAELLPDVMLLDVRMPVLGGLEAARRIRAANSEVRFVMLSAYDDATLQEESRQVDASAFLVKGCTLVDVVQAVTAA